jgi:hypothetical protein
MDASINEVTTRIGKLEQRVGAIKEEKEMPAGAVAERSVAEDVVAGAAERSTAEDMVGSAAEGSISGDVLGGAGPQDMLLGELAARVDAQLDNLQRKIGALEQVAEHRAKTPSGSFPDGVLERLAAVERRLAAGSQGGVSPVSAGERGGELLAPIGEQGGPLAPIGEQGGLPVNILQSLQHELESAKARIELQLGQSLDAKTAAVDQRLTEVAAEVHGRVSEIEVAFQALQAEKEEPASASRELALDAPLPVLMEDFQVLCDKVGVMEPKVQQAGDSVGALEQQLQHAGASAVAMEQKLQETAASAVVMEQKLQETAATAAAAMAATGASAEEKKASEKKQEERMSAMWSELAGHAEAAAVRADGLERGLMSRIEKIETDTMAMLQEQQGKKKDAEMQLKKSMEWVNWRISWLEWATQGEKRSFARSVDQKAFLPSPPPNTIAAAGFSQPITEDMELWTRDRNTGKPRLRRELNAPPQGFADASNGPNGPIGTLRGTASAGRLPRLTQ